MQARQLTRADAQFIRDPGPRFLQIELHPLVVDGDSVLLGQTLVDHLSLEQDLGLSIASISGATSSTTRRGR
ncbi:hypothetical protein [Streptomyces neyagawaensis]|uniref:hypothetical protein n=1 Tax=Streptomyces neyagawaensis TaxID=42238 RepID=UPI003EBA6F36